MLGKPNCIKCGKELSVYKSKTGKCRNCYLFSEDTLSRLVNDGNKGRISRWGDCQKMIEKKKNRKFTRTFDKDLQLGKRRFRNQRYKLRKENAIGSHTFEEWQMLKEYYKNMCLCCKKQEPEIVLTEDHIIPLSMNGTDYITNIQPLCGSCNTRKNAKIISYLPPSFYLNHEEKGLVSN